MRRGIAAVLVVAWVLALLVPCGECRAQERREKLVTWVSPDSTWRMLGFRQFDREWLARGLEKRPQSVVGKLMYEQIAEEEGEWFLIQVDLVKIEKVTFTRNTKIVVTDKEGRKIESEAICCSPDRLQTSVYDSRESPVVVTMESVFCGLTGRGPLGAVKFRAGSISCEDMVSFEVVGAVEDRGGEEVE